MAFDKLEFKKNWERAEDFPTFEQDEAQVRKDMQCLHDETKAFLNDKLLPQMEQALNGKADDDNVLHKDETEEYTPTQEYHPATKKYVDNTAQQMAAGTLPDQSVTPIKMAPSFWDEVYKKDETYSKEQTYSKTEADALLAKKADQTKLDETNAAVKKVDAKFGNLLLHPANPVELGPYDVGDENWVCDGNGDAYKIYRYLCTSDYALSNKVYDDNDPYFYANNQSNTNAYTATIQKGRYSYGFWNRFYAYKLDHVTKQAILMCDLSSYIPASTTNQYADGIFSVDDQYIYMVIHTSTGAGTIYKFNHSGTLISSVASSNLSFTLSGYDTTYSVFNSNASRTIYQTKNFIVFQHRGGTYTTPTYQYHVVSKSTLKITTTWNQSTSYNRFACWYNSDIVMFDNGSWNAFYARKLTESGYTYLYSGTDEYSNKYETTKCPCTVSPSGSYTYYYPVFSKRTVDLETGKCYYYVTFADSEATYAQAVVSEDDLNVSTGILTVRSYYEIPYDISGYATGSLIYEPDENYDPVLHDFTSGGKPYEVYPAYVAPENPVTMKDGFTMAPYFKTDDYFYFVRTLDNQVFKCKNEDQYVIDRVIPFPEVT